MMNTNKKAPKLRFKGFTDDWEQRKLGNLATVEMNKRIFKEQTTTKGDIPFYKIGTFGSDADSFISRELFEEYKNKYPYPNIGDTLISASGSIGRTVVYNGEDAYYQDSNIVWLNHNGQIDNSFLLQFYNQVKWAGLEGSTIKRLYNKNILETNIALPKIEEQRLIGKFFKLVDSSITLYQRKLDKMKLNKRVLLQKLFPQNGCTIPEVRFKGFTDAWEQRKLGSIGSTYTGLSGKTKEDFGHGEAQYITYLNVFQNTISDITMTDKVEIDTTQNEVKYGDVLFTTSSETPEEVGMSSVWLGDTPNIYLNSFCFGFRPNQKINPYFLGYSLRAPYMRDKIKILAQGISRYNISKNKVMELEISLPNYEEQKLLGTFLQRIDLIITLHQCKLDRLISIKKALLQQLFV